MKKLIDLHCFPVKTTLKILLTDRTTGENIIWATDNYSKHGDKYKPNSLITEESLLKLETTELQPRVFKSIEIQKLRTKTKAEVYTPSWICNKMNNFCDEQWFGREDVFNKILEDNSWEIKKEKISFPENDSKKTWKNYVKSNILEITCGEAPYLVSRYDSTTGEIIDITKRVGILDRKLRVINENTSTEEEWLKWTFLAYKSVYGYEWQGDSLLIARINLLLTFCDYLKAKWNRTPTKKEIKSISRIISWNIWQMNGLTYQVPLNEQYCLIHKKNGNTTKTIKFIDLTRRESTMNKNNKQKPLFDFCIGNPPYQGENHQQLYPDFYLAGKSIAKCVEMIFPIGWQDPKTANNLGKLNKPEIKEDKQIVFIDNNQNVFPGVTGAEWTNIILWKKDYDNGLDGKQLIYTNGKNPENRKLIYDKKDIQKPDEIIELAKIVTNSVGFVALQTITSVRKPYGLSTDVIADNEKYGLPALNDNKQKDDDIKVYVKGNNLKWINIDYPLPKKTESFNKYKVFVPYAWGNMSTKSGLGGAFSNIIIAYPREICTETYLESGCFNDFKTAQKHAKYLMTRFCRALLYFNKTSQHSTTSWGAIPIQDYSEDWWNESISSIDEHLFEKYNIPKNIKTFVVNNIQLKSEKNIINY